MKSRKFVWTLVTVAIVCSLAILAAGCKDEAEDASQVKAPAAAAAAAKFVNVRCPIMDNPIDPAKVPASLVRVHDGKKVAFCCAGCPGTWDKLSKADKDAKLAKVMPATSP